MIKLCTKFINPNKMVSRHIMDYKKGFWEIPLMRDGLLDVVRSIDTSILNTYGFLFVGPRWGNLKNRVYVDRETIYRMERIRQEVNDQLL